MCSSTTSRQRSLRNEGFFGDLEDFVRSTDRSKLPFRFRCCQRISDLFRNECFDLE
ncbi:hypothetical protein M6B38_139755 [Iris pallida]|uniref:Uncharacterized protein n=1 Tax=Iris pallida TaxID=29817 RepID=A0AAX6FDY3_IRIPA|nr:hypothetical protein M6B38_139755 [Iris pallida]